MSELPTHEGDTVVHIDFRCLICGSQECAVGKFVFSTENNSFSDSFCNLYGIQSRTHRLDIQDIFEDSFFCSQCHQELSCIQALHSQMEKLKDDIQRIKNSCDLKLKELHPNPTANLLEAFERSYVGTTDSFGDEIRKKRTKLLKYSRISNLTSKAPSSSSKSSPSLKDGEAKTDSGNHSLLYSTEKSLMGQDIVHLDFDYEISSFDSVALDTDDAEAEIKNLSVPSDRDSEKEAEVRRTNSDSFDELGKQYRLKELSIRIERIKVEANTITLSKKRKSKRTIIRETRRLNLPYVCPQPGCVQRYSAELERNGHVKRVHEGMSQPFECSMCSHKFSSHAKFKDHSNTHNGLLPYKCSSPKCDKTFPMKTTMLQHFRRVHGSTDHRCDKCGSGFSAKHLLINHMRSHTTAKEFECDICQKSFRLIEKSSIYSSRAKLDRDQM